jgi:hypothetical protein
MEWFDEKIEKINDDKFLYKIVCFLLGGPKYRLSYKNLYLILYGLNRGKLGEEKAKKKAMERVIKIYKSHHNNNEPNIDNL